MALRLASMTGGEVVTVDSMQIYRGLDIGTAKPGPGERGEAPHHLLDVVEPDAPFDTGRFRMLALEVVQAILNRGRLPVLCGGTGLYFKALLYGLDAMPRGEGTLRAELEGTPLPELVAELRSRDPAASARIDLANPRRVQRAVELLRLTGRPLEDSRRCWGSVPDRVSGMVLLLERDRADLAARIDRRVEQMFASGLVEETRGLLARGLGGNRTAMQAIGYRQVVEHLGGERDLAATVACVKQRTRQLARRQMTWFRHQLPCRPVPVEREERAELTARRILKIWSEELGGAGSRAAGGGRRAPGTVPGSEAKENH